MIYQAIPQQPNMIPQELPMYQSPPTPQLQMIKAPLSQDDQYKRPVMGSIVMMCTLMLLAMDCMGLFEEVVAFLIIYFLNNFLGVDFDQQPDSGELLDLHRYGIFHLVSSQ